MPCGPADASVCTVILGQRPDSHVATVSVQVCENRVPILDIVNIYRVSNGRTIIAGAAQDDIRCTAGIPHVLDDERILWAQGEEQGIRRVLLVAAAILALLVVVVLVVVVLVVFLLDFG